MNNNSNQDTKPSVGFHVPPHLTFSSVYSSVSNIYRKRFDEALRNDIVDSVAMKHDGIIEENLLKRQYPTVSSKWHISSEDSKNPEQRKIVEEVTKIVKAIPFFQQLRHALSEDRYYGRAGSNIIWGRIWIGGERRWGIVDHSPVNGDKIGFRFDGTPTIAVSAMFRPLRGNKLIYDDIGSSLLLSDPYYRDTFIISKFHPSDSDFRLEPDKAGSVMGLGLRDRLYWPWWLRQEIMQWHLDALERIGSNGMLYGTYMEGNYQDKEDMKEALILLRRENYAVFPSNPQAGQTNQINNIPPSQIGYDVQFQLINYLDGIMKRMIVGQELAGETGSTGMGSGVAEFQESTFSQILKYDAKDQEEVLTNQLIKPIVKYNFGDMKFNLYFNAHAEKKDSLERMNSIRVVVMDFGLPVNVDDIYEAAGVSPPLSDSKTVQIRKEESLTSELGSILNENKRITPPLGS